mgnify:CR=1 FL=1
MSCEPIKVQTSNKIDLKLLIFCQNKVTYFRNSLPLYLARGNSCQDILKIRGVMFSSCVTKA